MMQLSISPASSEDEEFIPPPPPPPRILLLRGSCLSHVLAFLDVQSQGMARMSCRLFRDAHASSVDSSSNNDSSGSSNNLQYSSSSSNGHSSQQYNNNELNNSLNYDEDSLTFSENTRGYLHGTYINESFATNDDDETMDSLAFSEPTRAEGLVTPTSVTPLTQYKGCNQYAHCNQYTHTPLTTQYPQSMKSVECRITLPPGRLGIRLENKPSKQGTVVTLVGEDSPGWGKIAVGDEICGVCGVDVSRMDTFGILDIFQKHFNQERSITFLRPTHIYTSTPESDSLIYSTYTPESSENNLNFYYDELTPAIDNRSREMPVPYDGSLMGELDTINNTVSGDELNYAVCSNQSKAIMRASKSPVRVGMPTTPTTGKAPHPYGAPRTVPSADSDQLESLDLNSYESFNLPTPTRVTPDKCRPDKEFTPMAKRPSSSIPFDELEPNKLPPFPLNSTIPSCNAGEPSTVLDDSTYNDDDTITSYTSTSAASLSSTLTNDESTYTEGESSYLSSFTEASLVDMSLFTSLVQDFISNAQHTTKKILTPPPKHACDDAGPIKIGDSYYTHAEAIRKWKKARDKLSKSKKYVNNQEKLQRKLEKAAMDAATLMAANKTWDLAKKRAGRGKRDAGAAQHNDNDNKDEVELGPSAWEMEELLNILNWEKEKEAKRIKDAKDPVMLSIHDLIHRFSIFNFGSNDDDDKDEDEGQQNKDGEKKTKSRFDFLQPLLQQQKSHDSGDDVSIVDLDVPSKNSSSSHVDQDMIDVEKRLKELRFQYLTKSMEEEEEPFDCVVGSDGGKKEEPVTTVENHSYDEMEGYIDSHVEGEGQSSTFSEYEPQKVQESDKNDLDLELIQSTSDHSPIRPNNDSPIRTSSPAHSSRSDCTPSPPNTTSSYASFTSIANLTHGSSSAMTNDSSITEVAGCGARSTKMEFDPTPIPPDVKKQSDDYSYTASSLGSMDDVDIKELGSERDHEIKQIDDEIKLLHDEIKHLSDEINGSFVLENEDDEVNDLGMGDYMDMDMKCVGPADEENLIKLSSKLDMQPKNDDTAKSVVEKDISTSTASTTEDNSSTASEQSTTGAIDEGVEVESYYSADPSGVLNGDSTHCDQSAIISGGSVNTGITTLAESDYTSLQSHSVSSVSQRGSCLNCDSKPATILEDAVYFLLQACQGEMSDCPSQQSTRDSVIGSEYGTEIIFNSSQAQNPPVINRSPSPIHPLKEPERIVTERKPRISSSQFKSTSTSSPNKNTSKSNTSPKESPSKNTSKSSISPKSSPSKSTSKPATTGMTPPYKNSKSDTTKAKKMNPLNKLIKAQTSKRSSSKSSVRSRHSLSLKEVPDSKSASSRPATPMGLKIGFGIKKSRSSG